MLSHITDLIIFLQDLKVVKSWDTMRLFRICLIGTVQLCWFQIAFIDWSAFKFYLNMAIGWSVQILEWWNGFVMKKNFYKNKKKLRKIKTNQL